MKLTLESSYCKASIEVEGDELTIEEVVNKLVRPALLAQQFHPDNVDEVIGFNEYYE